MRPCGPSSRLRWRSASHILGESPRLAYSAPQHARNPGDSTVRRGPLDRAMPRTTRARSIAPSLHPRLVQGELQMSVRASTWAWHESESAGAARLVLLAIADHIHDDGFGAWPSQATLAEMTRLSVATIRRATAELVELGEVAVEDRAAPVKGREGRRPHMYSMPKFALSVSGNSGGLRSSDPSLRSPDGEFALTAMTGDPSGTVTRTASDGFDYRKRDAVHAEAETIRQHCGACSGTGVTPDGFACFHPVQSRLQEPASRVESVGASDRPRREAPVPPVPPPAGSTRREAPVPDDGRTDRPPQGPVARDPVGRAGRREGDSAAAV